MSLALAWLNGLGACPPDRRDPAFCLSPAGGDAGIGRGWTPFDTLERARRALRQDSPISVGLARVRPIPFATMGLRIGNCRPALSRAGDRLGAARGLRTD